MVALLTKLNFQLTIRFLRQRIANLVALGVVMLYGAGLIGAVLVGSYFLRDTDVPTIGWLTTLVLALLGVAWPIVESFGGTLDPLNPPRFSLLPVRARDLQPGLLAATILSLEGVGVLAFVIAFWIAWSSYPEALALAVVGGLIGFVTSAIGCRLGMTYVATRMASRRTQDRIMLIVMLGILGFAAGMVVLSNLFADNEGSLVISLAGVEAAAPYVGWTPFGWAWSLPWDAAAGVWWAVGVKAVLALGVLGVLWWLWARVLDRALTTPFSSGGRVSQVGAQEKGLVGVLPKGPVGAIARRTWRNWGRDPRRKIQGIAAAAMPIIFSFAMHAGSGGAARELQLLVPLGTVALMATSLVATEITFDGGALWHQIVVGISGRVDRWGRVLGMGLIIGPYALVMSLAYLAWTGQWQHTVLMLSTMAGVVGVAFGVGSWSGAVWNYAVPPPGITFNSSSGSMSAMVGSLIGGVVQTALLLPIAIAVVAAYWNPAFTWVAVLTSVGVGVAALVGGVRLGAAYLDGHFPEVLARVTWSKR